MDNPLILGTPVEDHLKDFGLMVKREDLSCPPPGPPFSKTRGVFAHVRARYDEGVRLFGVLDTSHSQAGHAVAYACSLLPGSLCWNFFPVYKDNREDGDHLWPKSLNWPQQASSNLGASLRPLQAGRSAILFHQAKRETEAHEGYMMPNALRLGETIEETADEVRRTLLASTPAEIKTLANMPWMVSASSGTIAAGVLKGLSVQFKRPPPLILHMGYSRSRETALGYVREKSGCPDAEIVYVDEGYAYADQAKPGASGSVAPWPTNPFYDRKALFWWQNLGRQAYGRALSWNIG